MRLEAIRGQGRDAARCFDQRGGTLTPCAKPRDFFVERGGQALFLLGADEREDGAIGYGHIGVAGQLQHASVCSASSSRHALPVTMVIPRTFT